MSRSTKRTTALVFSTQASKEEIITVTTPTRRPTEAPPVVHWDISYRVTTTDPELRAMEIIQLAIQDLQPNQRRAVLGYSLDRIERDS